MQILRYLILLAVFSGFAWAHPHEPPPREVPDKDVLTTLKAVKALPMNTTRVLFDGSVQPTQAASIMNELAKRPLKELHIYRATEWEPEALEAMAKMTCLENFSLSDDSRRAKRDYWGHIAKAKTLKRLYMHLSGE